MDAKLQRFCALIIQCLVRYGGIEERNAQQLVDKFGLCMPKTEMSRMMLFHETAYYWAMWLLHDNPLWYLDPALWPPPKEYYEWSQKWLEGSE